MKEFSSFGAMATHLLSLVVVEKAVEHELLESACEQIEDRAKEKIGEYQAQAGPFEEWQPLAASTVDQKEQLGFAPPDNPLLRTGDMRDSIEHKVSGSEGHVGSNSDVALFQELGTEKMPARSFLGGAAFELEPKIREEIGLGFVSFLSGGGKKVAVR